MALATALRLAWVLVVPTVPVSDFAMYRESANFLSEFGHLDPGFIYMPGFVALLALIKDAGGELLAQKLLGVALGGVGAGALFALTYRLADTPPAAGARSRCCPCPRAAVATALYAVWPAGLAMSSVVGTDVPAAALIVTALALLVSLGPRRPFWAAIAFGVVMGLAAWVRAVALPLSALGIGYWLARRERLRRAVVLAGIGVLATLVVLLPWGVRHVRESGELYFTDDHGGITALIGANPNSEGTYTRALNALFKEVTGRGVLDTPHRQTDQAAAALAREWLGFERGYALGMAILKADRLFDPEHRLLYWPLLREGVLVHRSAAFVAAHRAAICRAADLIGLGIAGLALAGIGVAIANRNAGMIALLPLQAALTFTYTVFFAEPRYRIPIEMLGFPFAALALVDGARAVVCLARGGGARLWSKVNTSGSLSRFVSKAFPSGSSNASSGNPAESARRSPARAVPGGITGAARLLFSALIMVLAWRALWPAVLGWGDRLRERHRWAVTEVSMDGNVGLLYWKPTPPFDRQSPLSGAPNGVHVRLNDATRTTVRVVLGQRPLQAGAYLFQMRIEGKSATPSHIAIAAPMNVAVVDVPPETTRQLQLPIAHRGGRFSFDLTLEGAPNASVWLSGIALTARPSP